MCKGGENEMEIEKIIPEQLRTQAGKMRAQGEIMQRESNEVRVAIHAMHSFWTGKRYYDLVQEVNKTWGSQNRMIMLCYGTIPTNMEKAANNYAEADNQPIGPVNSVEWKLNAMIDDIPEGEPIKYKPDNVGHLYTSILSHFEDIGTALDEFEKEFIAAEWNSTQGESFKEDFITAKANMKTTMEKISSEIKKYMDAANLDMFNAENQYNAE